jgi:hypothetical protein
MSFSITDHEVETAMGALSALANVPGRERVDRLRVLREHQTNPALRELFKRTFEFTQPLYLTLGDDEFLPTDQAPAWKKNFDEFITLSELYSSGRLGGLDARLSADRFLGSVSSTESFWYRKIWNRNLECGVALGLLSEVFNEFDQSWNIARPRWGSNDPQIGLELAAKLPIAIERWPDANQGMRVQFIFSKGKIVAYSDGQREYPILVEALGQQLLRALDGRECVIEGFVTARDWLCVRTFLSSRLKSLRKADFKSTYYALRFTASDMTTLEIFSNRLGQQDPTPESIRRQNLTQIVEAIRKKNRNSSIRLMPQLIFQNLPDLYKALCRILMIEPGTVFLRPLESAYRCGVAAEGFLWQPKDLPKLRVMLDKLLQPVGGTDAHP